MPDIVKYDKYYADDPQACGDPFAEFIEFFGRHIPEPVRVLDLGCGQGRDALFVARLGHSVFGVDVSEVGIHQMLESARLEKLDVDGVVGDASGFKSRSKFDVVLLDRVVHMLSDAADQHRLLRTAERLTRKNGHVLVADTKKNREMIRSFFCRDEGGWSLVLRRADFLFVKKDGGESAGRRV